MPLLDAAGQKNQIEKTDAWLRERGVEAKALAMPFTPFNDDTIRALDELDYECLLTVFAKSNPPGQTDKVLTLHRWLAPATAAELKGLV
jgi:hypothetical protein